MAKFNSSLFFDHPIKKARKRKIKRKGHKQYKVFLAKENIKDYFMGSIHIGSTNDTIEFESSTEYIATFNNTEELILQYKNSMLLVKLAYPSDFIRDILTSKAIKCNFLVVDKEFHLKLYFATLPIENTSKSCKLLKAIFNLVCNIGTKEEPAEESKAKGELAIPEDVALLYASLNEKRKNAFNNESAVDLQHSYLKPTLHPYQKEAVRWMLKRECSSNRDKVLNPLYQPVTLPSSITMYYDKYSGMLMHEKPLIDPLKTGGILADEMGLGKTVEVLACILNNPLTSSIYDTNDFDKEPSIEFVTKRPKLDPTHDDYNCESKEFKDTVKKSNYMLLSEWYNKTLESTKVKSTVKRKVTCICGNTSMKNTIKCSICERQQHRKCMGYRNELGDFKCSQCWNKSDNITCKGTLIVCPMSLRKQWIDELKKHVRGNFSVLVYEGIAHSAIYPTMLTQYDLVITTYNVLQNELRLTENAEERNLRNPPKYSHGGCPISNMKWWRLCLDEAQVIENRVMVTEMSKRLDAVHKWAVTGTPISKNLNDIHTLIDYLEIEPYSDGFCWKQLLYKPYLKGDVEPMHNFLSNIMWRTCKADVLDQINIPNQKIEEHWLEFTEIEMYFYKREYDVRYCDLIKKLSCHAHETQLKSLDNKSFKEIWTPFLALRQACVHHNALKGKYLNTRKTVTSIDHLLDVLIEKNVQENEEYLRMFISTLNGLAGIYLLLQNPTDAVNEYLRILDCVQKYSEKSDTVSLKVDTLQLIHVLHNLSEILTNFSELDRNGKVSSYKEQCAELERKFIEKHTKVTFNLYNDLMVEAKAIDDIQKQFTCNSGEWFTVATDYIISCGLWNEYCGKVYTRILGEESEKYTNGSSGMLYNIVKWHDDIIKLRKSILKKFKSICGIDTNQPSITEKVVLQAMECHLRPDEKKRKNKKDCCLCVAKANLASYESTLFDMKENKKGANVGVYKQTGAEIALRGLYSVFKTINDEKIKDVIADAKIYMDLLEKIKTEFKIISKYYLHIDREISCKDEINMCKMRFSLKDTEQETTTANKRVQSILKQLENTMSNNNYHEIAENNLDYQKAILQNQQLQQIQDLERNLGTHSYLKTLKSQQSKAGQTLDPCPICTYPLLGNWNMLKCGHSFCIECIQKLINQHSNEKHITCSICRQRQLIQDISFISLNTNNGAKSEIVGNVSTKLDAVVRLILKLKEEDIHVKVLIFSTWANILSILHTVLKENGLSSELIKTRNMENNLNNFKDKSKGVTALLMPINFGGKGLNIVEASHMIFLEALVDVGQELQAIGRIHRIGQLKETTIHKFLIRNTIEEKIYQAVSSDANKWNQNTMTLGQIFKLFGEDS